MEEMVTGDLESQNSNDGGANGSNLIATTILYPMVRGLAFSASNKAQKRVLKQAAALKRGADTEFRNTFRCMQAEKRARELESTLVEVTTASKPQIVHNNQRPVLNAGVFVVHCTMRWDLGGALCTTLRTPCAYIRTRDFLIHSAPDSSLFCDAPRCASIGPTFSPLVFFFQMTSFPIGFPLSLYTCVVLVNLRLLHSLRTFIFDL
jgi:hypothetical protein